MDGIVTLRFFYAGEELRKFSFAQVPVVPRVGEEIIGEGTTYTVTKAAHEYWIDPFSQDIHITLV